jgi:hypothetical protein
LRVAVALVNEKLAHARGGEVVLYKRGDSKKWQARFKLKDLKWHRLATKQQNLQYAKRTKKVKNPPWQHGGFFIIAIA